MPIFSQTALRAPGTDLDHATSIADSEEEDDYMTMTFTEAPAPQKETLTQARKRKLLHAETAGRQKSKAELAAEEAQKREEGLAKRVGDGAESNKGLKMMEKLGYKHGMALGPKREGSESARLEPIGLAMKEDRSGIGQESEAKRKFREEAARLEQGEKKRKVEEGEFVERVRTEREAKRNEGQVFGAQKVCERLEEEKMTDEEKRRRKLKGVNVLWRGLIRQRELNEREKRTRRDVYTSLGRQPEVNDPEEDKDDRIALGKKADMVEIDDEELDEEDPELQDFEALESAERLTQLVAFLREKWHYCFWCKYRYPDDAMEGCPGTTEEDHD